MVPSMILLARLFSSIIGGASQIKERVGYQPIWVVVLIPLETKEGLSYAGSLLDVSKTSSFGTGIWAKAMRQLTELGLDVLGLGVPPLNVVWIAD